MKKRHMVLFLASVLLLSTLCACGQQTGQTEQPEGGGGHSAAHGIEKPQPEKTKEIAVTELYSEEGSGTSDGFPYNYSFHVPQIEDDTADAAAINQEISSTYGEVVKECLESIQNKELPYCSSVEYVSSHSGDILSGAEIRLFLRRF